MKASSVSAYLELARWQNCLIAAAGVVVGAYFFAFPLSAYSSWAGTTSGALFHVVAACVRDRSDDHGERDGTIWRMSPIDQRGTSGAPGRCRDHRCRRAREIALATGFFRGLLSGIYFASGIGVGAWHRRAPDVRNTVLDQADRTPGNVVVGRAGVTALRVWGMGHRGVTRRRACSSIGLLRSMSRRDREGPR